MVIRNLIILFVVLTVLPAALFVLPSPQMDKSMDSMTTLTIRDTVVLVELADTEVKRRQGLSGREKLSEGSGMFFIFDTEDSHGIWMKDMCFPIDIIWLNSNFEVVSMRIGARPESFPEIFIPEKKATYVLEVGEGFIPRHNIVVGDTFTAR